MRKSIKTKAIVCLLGVISGAILFVTVFAVHSIVRMGGRSEKITGEALQFQAEDFLTHSVSLTAQKMDMVFERVRDDAAGTAAYVQAVLDTPRAFASGSYWKFDDHVVQGPGGQHLNGPDDLSSVFIPSYIPIDDTLKQSMEGTAYSELLFPEILRRNANAVAVWIVGRRGETRYYPNIGLGHVLAPDFDCTREMFYAPADPDHNPERKVIWSAVYDDPAGQGLMITAMAPVYTKAGGFAGVVGIDNTLSKINGIIERYQPTEDFHFFLIDRDGYSISLSGGAREHLLEGPSREEGARTDLNHLTNDHLDNVIHSMKAGASGFQEVHCVHGHGDIYVAYAPLESTGFGLGMIIDKSSVLKAVGELKKTERDSVRRMVYRDIWPMSLLILFGAGGVASWVLGRMIRPIKDLTSAAAEIAQGRLDRDIEVRSGDEIGQLAAAFKTMVENLKTAQEALRNEKEQLQITLQSIGDGVIATDKRGNVVLMNGVAAHLTGWTQEEAVGRPLVEVFKIINEKTRKPCENPVEKAIRERGIIALANDTLLISRDGTERIIMDSGSPIWDSRGDIRGVVLVFRDNTEHRKKELEIRKLSQAVAYSPSSVLITDREGIIQYVNPKFTEVTGYPADLLIGTVPFILRPDKLPPEDHRRLLETITSGKEWRGEYKNKKKNGEDYWEAVVISSLRDHKGKLSHFLITAEDITQRKLITEKLAEEKKSLEIFYESAVNQEIDAIVLKKEVNALLQKQGLAVKYPEVEEIERLIHLDEEKKTS